MRLAESYRPRSFREVIGQNKAIGQIAALEPRGLAGRNYWISGVSGTGKTTIARILAHRIAGDAINIEELDAQFLPPSRVAETAQFLRTRPIFGCGSAIVVNEAHGLRRDSIRALLCALEDVPAHASWIFTTTLDGQAMLFDDKEDTAPLLSRCTLLALTNQGLARLFAERAREIALLENLDFGAEIDRFIKLLQACKNNMRAALEALEGGAMR